VSLLSRGSSISEVGCCGLDGWGSIPGRRDGLLS